MTREERINSALLPILEKMREHGATDEMCEMYSNGFRVGAMWADAAEVKRVEAIIKGGTTQQKLF